MRIVSRPKPWGLWFFTLVTFGFDWHFLMSEQAIVPAVFSLAAGLLLFFPFKITWTIASSWLLISIIGALNYLNIGFAEMAPYERHALITFVVNTVIQLIAIGNYFRFPYINSRESMVGAGTRFSTALEGRLISGESVCNLSVVNLSATGAAISITSTKEFPIDLGKKVFLEIPNVDGFKMKARVVRQDQNNVWAIQFQSFSIYSVREQLKIMSWLRQQKALSRLQSQSGFTLMEAMIVCGISTILIFSTSGLIQEISRVSVQNKLLFEIQDLRNRMAREMRNSQSWILTLNDSENTVLECLRNRTVCEIDRPTAINLRNYNNELLLSGRNEAWGFTSSGMPCTEYNSVDGNDSCPLRLVLTARAICDGECLNPTIELALNVFYNPNKVHRAINTRNFTTLVYRDPLIDSLANNCVSLQGVFDAGTGTCTFDLIAGACRARGEYLAGVTNGQPDCRTLSASPSCPQGRFLQGFNDADGSPICVAL